MDRRVKERHELQLVCRFGTASILSAPYEGVTQNVSRDGILMHWLHGVPLPEPGDSLNVEVDLPSGSDFGPRVMRCVTTVVRIVDGKTGIPLVGLRINKVRFTRPGKKRQFDLAAMKPATDTVN
jgi:hypothetical protein